MKQKHSLLALVLALMMILSCACAAEGGALREPAQAGSAGSTDDKPGQTNVPETKAPEKQETTISEAVIYEADGVRVTVTGYSDGWMGPEVRFLVENDTDRDILVSSQMLSANGYMLPFSSFFAEVSAGKKANETLTLLSSELERCGIETLADLQFFLQVADAESWDTLAESELITLSTSNAGLEQPVDDSGDVLYNEGGIRVICKGLKQDMIWDGTIVFFLENLSGEDILVSAENVSVNGFMQEAGLWSELRSGTRLIDGMTLIDLSDMGIDSIDQVQEVEFRLQIIESDDWDVITETDTLVLTFE